MGNSKEKEPTGLTRREALKISGLALGGLAIGGSIADKVQADTSGCCLEPPITYSWINPDKTNYDTLPSQVYSYIKGLTPFYPFSNLSTTIAPLQPDEMRITFMGSMIPPVRKAQQEMSIFVEVGWDSINNRPVDQFVFDCGSGVCANYGAMNVGYGRMDKIFLAHLHGDHMSDLTHIYCFGPSGDRKSPLYVFGPSPSGVPNPLAVSGPGGTGANKYYDDGTNAFCANLRAACRWHTESFSFQTTSYPGYPSQAKLQKDWGLPCKPTPVGDDPWGDGYAMVPIQLNWQNYGKVKGDNVAYCNKTTGAKITHFPVIHTRRGSIGYKLEWWPQPAETGNQAKPHLTMMYTSDTKPETHCLDQAKNWGNGVDVFIHEMVVPPNVWAMKMNDSKSAAGIDTPPDSSDSSVQQLTMVQNSSHTPQGAYGYLLSQITPLPRLSVATHFPVADDTVLSAMNSVQAHFPSSTVWQGNNPPSGVVRITWSFDLMVITVSKDTILEQQGYVTDFGFSPTVNLPPPPAKPNTPKYWTWGTDNNGKPVKVGNPFAQIDRTTEIDSCGKDGTTCNYRADGY